MKFVIPSVKENFVNDYKSNKYTTKKLITKYKFKSTQDYYCTVSFLRKEGLLPETTLSKSIKAYYDRKQKGTTTVNTVTTRNTPVVDYRTVYFKDFTVQIHKKTMARLVVDQNNNLHILNN